MHHAAAGLGREEHPALTSDCSSVIRRKRGISNGRGGKKTRDPGNGPIFLKRAGYRACCVEFFAGFVERQKTFRTQVFKEAP